MKTALYHRLVFICAVIAGITQLFSGSPDDYDKHTRNSSHQLAKDMENLERLNTSTVLRLLQSQQQQRQPETELKQVKYMLGFSTGHAGSTTAHEFLKGRAQGNCGWQVPGLPKQGFESVLRAEADGSRIPFAQEEPSLSSSSDLSPSCEFTKQRVLPYLEKQREDQVWIDLGHYRNRHDILECLVDLLQSQLSLVHIRRDRYQIANSFLKDNDTPCQDDGFQLSRIHKKRTRPAVSYCPHSQEHNGAPLALPVPNDTVWDQFTPFQKFLWLADDMEYRWYRLLQKLLQQHRDALLASQKRRHKEQSPTTPWLHEITWSQGAEFESGLFQVLEEMQCSGNRKRKKKKKKSVPNKKQHVKHGKASKKECKQMIYEDLDYRRQMQFTDEQNFALFQQYPQHLMECAETAEELELSIARLAKSMHVQTGLRHWVVV